MYTCGHGIRRLCDDGPSLRDREEVHQEKNDWNESLEEGSSLPLDLDPNEVIEANEDTLPTQKRTGKTPNK